MHWAAGIHAYGEQQGFFLTYQCLFSDLMAELDSYS